MAIFEAVLSPAMEKRTMKRIMLIGMLACALVTTAFARASAHAGQLLINEIACGTKGDDWVELTFRGDARESMDISNLFVTMYYGTNEPLAVQPVTIYSYDRPETPYDDRYVVVHLVGAGRADETDLTGDTNRNGWIDVYCENHPDSLWNTDGVVAIDADDDPANGGIVDFVGYSNRDGSVSEAMAGYLRQALDRGQWSSCAEENVQQCMADIGPAGLEPHQSLSRLGSGDSNSAADFRVTSCQTPGRPNAFDEGRSGGGIFSLDKDKITIVPTHPTLGGGSIALTVHETCSIRLRIFNSIGMLVYESPLYRDINPGAFAIRWDSTGKNRPACTGLYYGLVEANNAASRRTLSRIVYIIVSRYQ